MPSIHSPTTNRIEELTQQKLKEFDEWRNDGEHCSLDDSMLNNFDVLMLKEFLQSSLQEAYEAGQLSVKDIKV